MSIVPSYAAFLRGMNVGGHRLTNDELRAHFQALGFAEVATFRASGNVTFAERAAAAPDPDGVRARIEAGLERLLGYAVPAFIRSHDEVRAIAAHEPFEPEQLRASAGKPQVSLLASAPAAGARRAVLAMATGEDRLAFGERELYWLPSGGLLQSPLDLDAIDRLLGVGTRRTKGTIEQIAARLP
ncbi:MAG TPA: DUF1697 domain-containing protein [Solirubrobacteraceae bacterium]|nr:DUF1697 domain-containing protein [Solirubrobacteraceae bacterium]